MLQYWNELSREYIDYVKFELSENESSSVELGRPSGGGDEGEEVMVSTLWRVLILHPDNRHEQEEKADTPKQVTMVTVRGRNEGS